MATMTTNALNKVDDEWQNFISAKYEDEDDDDVSNEELGEEDADESILSADIAKGLQQEAPKATEIYISTKSKIAYLNQPIDLKTLFWGIKVIPYSTPRNGVIKKQMKFNSLTQEEHDEVQENLKNETHYDQQIITSINNPTGRIKFKDIRKISVGVSKKDIMSYRCKQKSAFYNCFVMIMRIKIQSAFKEFHIKVFNTGKMEIPGVQNDDIFQAVLNNILTTMQPFVKDTLSYNQKSDTVLINSNFNCGFFINREVLFDLMKYKYNIQCIYDPCSYPGIQCKFYYNKDLTEQTGSQISEEDKNKYKNIVAVSFMIFRTGSILIVGMCDENVLFTIYEFLKKMLVREFSKINQKIITAENTPLKEKKTKVRRKSIFVDVTV
jgi:TATA-box binding protein (TBP) (component of TFIID and TFIIIB)